MEAIIATLIGTYGTQIWLAFVTFFATGFAMSLIKNLIQDVALYQKARMSDLGKGAMIIWKGKLKMVKTIHFRYIEVYDDEEVTYIPIKTWFSSDQIYPKPWEGQFHEEKWKHWDGKTDRRTRIDEDGKA